MAPIAIGPVRHARTRQGRTSWVSPAAPEGAAAATAQGTPTLSRGLCGSHRSNSGCYHPRARGCGLLYERSGASDTVPNIRQQEKRVKVAARQRLENLRYRSTIKTLAKRLETTVADGDADAISAAHLALVRTIDKAASHGAIHRNTAARKKSQAARVAAGSS